MKTAIAFSILVVSLVACHKSEVISDFTGNQASYGLIQTSTYPISGTVTFKERKDGTTTIIVQLKGTNGYDQLPVHLHQGDVVANSAGTVALLNSLSASTGISSTVVSTLADGTKVSYSQLLKTSAYVNIHASSTGPESAVILAAGNIGTSTVSKSAALLQIGNCLGNK